MAKFVKQTSDLAQSLNRLQGFAENLISSETNRRIQLGREKEARMVEAYQYMLGNENEEIADLEAGLDLIEQNLMTRGVELKSVKDEYKTIASEELLAAANEGAVELLNVKLEASRGHRDSLQERKSKAMEIKRSIDLFDDALALADPSLFGDPDLVEAGDIAKAIEILGIESENFQDEVEDYIKFGEKVGLTHLVTDGKSAQPKILNDIFYNEKNYPYLLKQFDSIEHGFKYHMKIYEIDFHIFEKYLENDFK